MTSSGARAAGLVYAVLLACGCSGDVSGPAHQYSEYAFLQGGVWLGDTTGLRLRHLLPELTRGARTLAWSPSGRTLAVGVDSTLILLDVETRAQKTIRMVGATGAVAVISLKWSPAGDRIVFAGATANDPSREIFAVRADGTDLRNLTQTPQVEETWPAWSPDGRRLAFVHVPPSTSRAEIWVMNADGGEKRFLTAGRSPEWSPNGRRLAFDDLRDVFVINVDGSGLLPIARAAEHGVEWMIMPRWDSRSDRVLVTSRREWERNVWAVAADGSAVVQLTAESDAVHAEWSPDGNNILWRGQSGIHLMAADGTGNRIVVRDGTLGAAWRPASR